MAIIMEILKDIYIWSGGYGMMSWQVLMGTTKDTISLWSSALCPYSGSLVQNT
jgi:hypothetical protein